MVASGHPSPPAIPACSLAVAVLRVTPHPATPC
jgi:hypothetical protein